jgi:D-alanyl-D-alanine carboxypeptidase
MRKKWFSTNIVVLKSLLFSLHFSCSAQTDLRSKIGNLIKSAAIENIFSGVVLVVKDDQIIYHEGVGFADIEKKIQNATTTLFQIGSISKIFTQTIIYQLAYEKKLNLEDRIGKYLTDFPKTIAEVTIEQLVHHRSGLGNYYDIPNWSIYNAKVQQVSDILPAIKQEQLSFVPGSQTKYSNSGYVLLSAIAEEIEKKNLVPF